MRSGPVKTREDLLRPLGGGTSARGRELLERLGRGRDHRRRVTWPGGTLELELEVLSRAATAEAHAAAIEACGKRGIDQSSQAPRAVEARADEEIVQILARAILDPATHAPLFGSAQSLAELATDDELVTLFNAYSDLRAHVDPDPEDISAEDFAAFEEAVKKKDEIRLRDIVSFMPRTSLRSLVLRLATSPPDRSSPTSTSSAPPLDASASSPARE